MSRFKEIVTYPSDWKTKKLGELGSFLKGKGISKSETKESGLPCIRYGEIYTHHHYYIKEFYSFIDEETAKKSTGIRKGDILFAGSGETMEEIGKSVAFLHDEKAYAGGDIIILRTQGVNSQYLAFALNEGRLAKERAKLGQGHSVVHIYPKDLKELIVYLPSEDEQQKIASILSTWDKAIELKEKMIEEKRQLKKGLMQKLLTGEMRLPGFNESWIEMSMDNCIKILNGFPFKSKFFNEEKVGIPLIRVRDIKAKEITTYYSGDYSEEYIIKKGDLLVGMDGEFNITMWDKIDGLLNQRVMKVIPKRGFDLYFIFQLLMPKLKKIEMLTPSTTVKHLSNKDIYSLKVKMPSYPEQKAIGMVLFKSDKEIALLESEVAYLKKQKKGLMQLLLTGKVRVQV